MSGGERDVRRAVEKAPVFRDEGAPAGDDAFFDDGGDGPPPDDPSIDWETARECAREPQNDIGNSRRLRRRYGDRLLHVQKIAWHVYDDARWCEDVDEARSRPYCHKVVEAIALEAHLMEPSEQERAAMEAGEDASAELEDIEAQGKDAGAEARARARTLRRLIKEGERVSKAVTGRRTARRRFANASGNSGKIDGMLNEARAYLSRPVRDFDAEPLAFNVTNGTLRLAAAPDPECPDPDATRLVWAVRLDPHRREDLITKLAAVAYDPDAACPLFDAFIARVLPAPAVRDYVRRYFGYCLTALTKEQVFALFHGEGRNGKSTLVDVIARIFDDYSTNVPISTLVNNDSNKRGSEATPDLARLPGARLVRAAEPKEGLAFDESLIKGLTAGESVPVRRLNQEFVDIYPTFKLVISANRKPTIKGNDDGIWRRVSLVPFDVQIPEGEADKDLPDKLWDERSGILNWLIGGALDYLARGGLQPPPEVRAATQDYRDESDLMGAFVRAALEVTRRPADTETPGALYEAFTAYCKRQALTPFTANTFTRRMPKTAAQHGFEKGKASTSVYYGVRIRDEFNPSRTQGLGFSGG